MKKINLTITGCMGRMGQQLIKSTNKNKNFKIVSLTENRKINKKISGIRPKQTHMQLLKKNKCNYRFYRTQMYIRNFKNSCKTQRKK